MPVNLEHPGQLAQIVADLSALRRAAGSAAQPYDVIATLPPGGDPAPYAAAGATWWLVEFPPRGSPGPGSGQRPRRPRSRVLTQPSLAPARGYPVLRGHETRATAPSEPLTATPGSHLGERDTERRPVRRGWRRGSPLPIQWSGTGGGMPLSRRVIDPARLHSRLYGTTGIGCQPFAGPERDALKESGERYRSSGPPRLGGSAAWIQAPWPRWTGCWPRMSLPSGC